MPSMTRSEASESQLLPFRQRKQNLLFTSLVPTPLGASPPFDLSFSVIEEASVSFDIDASSPATRFECQIEPNLRVRDPQRLLLVRTVV